MSESECRAEGPSTDAVCVRGTVGCTVDHDALARERPMIVLTAAEHELAQAESLLATEQRYWGAPGRSVEVSERAIQEATARVNSAAARLMAAAARATLAGSA